VGRVAVTSGHQNRFLVKIGNRYAAQGIAHSTQATERTPLRGYANAVCRRETKVLSNHQLKLVLFSPSFNHTRL